MSQTVCFFSQTVCFVTDSVCFVDTQLLSVTKKTLSVTDMSAFVTDIICLFQIIFFVTDSMCLSDSLCLSRKVLFSVSLSLYQTLVLIILGQNFIKICTWNFSLSRISIPLIPTSWTPAYQILYFYLGKCKKQKRKKSLSKCLHFGHPPPLFLENV